jgi:hypothetical protein
MRILPWQAGSQLTLLTRRGTTGGTRDGEDFLGADCLHAEQIVPRILLWRWSILTTRRMETALTINCRMAFRFEFDSTNKILLLRVEGPLTDEVLAECYDAIRKYSIATDASAGILDLSFVTEFPVSTEFIRQLARREPAMPHATSRLRILVAPQIHAFGLLRMFQTLGESTRPMLKVAHTLDEAFRMLGVPSPHFEPLA